MQHEESVQDKLNYKVIASGSKGNCAIIEDVMIDCGIPYVRLKEYLYDIKYLLLTHIHSDHINRSTYKRIRKEFPNIITIGNYEIYQLYKTDKVSNDHYPLETERYTFLPFDLDHDVICQGYTWKVGERKIIYATDTNNLDNAPKDKYDYMFIESNHDTKKLEAVRGNGKKYGYDVYANGIRHLSTQKCYEFYYLNRVSRDSELVELHKSSRFY